MKHPSCRQLYEYWNERRGLRAAPESSEIEPGAIRRVLADTFMLGVDPHGGHPFHIAGTRVCAAFGRELKAQAFMDLWGAEHREPVCKILSVVLRESRGVVASASARTATGVALEFELLLLPLKQRGQTNSRVLGALAPASMPDWFGVQAVGALGLGPHRYLGHHGGIGALPRLIPTLPVGNLTRGFVVYEGGRS